MSLLRLPEGERRTVLAPFPLALHYRETLSHELLEIVKASSLVEGLEQAKFIVAIHITPEIAVERGFTMPVVRLTSKPDLIDRTSVNSKRDGDVRILFREQLDNRRNARPVLVVDGLLDKVVKELLLIDIEELLVIRLILGTKVLRLEGGKIPKGPNESDFFHIAVLLEIDYSKMLDRYPPLRSAS